MAESSLNPEQMETSGTVETGSAAVLDTVAVSDATNVATISDDTHISDASGVATLVETPDVTSENAASDVSSGEIVSETPTVTEVPDVPSGEADSETPAVSDDSSVEAVAEQPTESPTVAEVPEVPSAETVSETPAVTEASDATSTEAASETPTVAEVPEVPSTKAVSEAPIVAEVPAVSTTEADSETPIAAETSDVASEEVAVAAAASVAVAERPVETIAEPEPVVLAASPAGDATAITDIKERSWVYSLFLMLATMVGGLSSVCIKQLLLPIQVSILAPANTNTSFTIVASVGAFAGLVAAPLTGALSDRTTLRWGRRGPWIVFGTITAVVGMIIMAFSTTIPVLLFGEILAQIGVDTILSTVTALIPDQVPPSQRSFISALVGLAPNVGGVVGLILVTRLTNTRIVSQGYILMAVASFLFIALFMLILRERPVTREAVGNFRLGRFLASFAHPLKSSDFVYVLVSRCFVYLSFTILGAYLLFYLRGAIHMSIPNAAASVTTFQLLSTVVLLVTAIITGIFSDRLKRLKPFVLIGALLMAAGLLLMSLVPAWGALLTAAVIFGGGFGLYLGVDIALAVRVLPSDANRGKDLGIIYTSIFLSLILSPIIGGAVLNATHNNYALLFAIAGASSLIAAGLIIPIKSVR